MSNDLEHEPSSYALTWTRGVDGSFNHVAKEKFAAALAAGKTITEASDIVGISTTTGLKWSKQHEMRLRKKELRQSPAISQTFVVSIAMIVAELHKNATMARDEGDYKASTDALVHMYKIAKAEKTLLETFDAKIAGGQSSAELVGALQAHLGMAADASKDEDGFV